MTDMIKQPARSRVTPERHAEIQVEKRARAFRRAERKRLKLLRAQDERDVILDDYDRLCRDQELRLETKLDGSLRRIMDDRYLRLLHDGGFESRK